MKKRLDVLLVERGLAASRAQAQALVLAGRVRGYDKPGTQVDDAAPLEVEGPPHDRRFVCAAHVAGEQLGVGRGSTKKAAEQEAAKEALAKLGVEIPGAA